MTPRLRLTRVGKNKYKEKVEYYELSEDQIAAIDAKLEEQYQIKLLKYVKASADQTKTNGKELKKPVKKIRKRRNGGLRPTDDDLAILLPSKGGWTEERVGDFLNSRPGRFFEEEQARQMATFLEIPFDESDYEPQKEHPRAHSLALSLSLLCLCLDRFSEGGWGFSLEEEYLIDGDNHIIVAGVDEVNLLCLQSLRNLLKQDTIDIIIQELEEQARNGIRSLDFKIEDRKQSFAAWLASLTDSQKSEYKFRLLYDYIILETNGAKQDRYFVIRPTINTKNDINDKEHIMLSLFRFLFYDQLHTLVNKTAIKDWVVNKRKERESIKVMAERATKAWAENIKTTRLRYLDDAIKHMPNLLEDTRLMFNSPNSSSIRSIIQLLLLCKNPDVVERIVTDASKLKQLNIDTDLSDKLSLEALYCLLLKQILITNGENDPKLDTLKFAFEKRWQNLSDKLTRDLIKSITGMNAIGWACLIQLITYQDQDNPSIEENNAIWNNCDKVRKSMWDIVRKKYNPEVLRSNLVDRLMSKVIFKVTDDSYFAKNFAESLLNTNTLIQPDSWQDIGQDDSGHQIGILEIEAFTNEEGEYEQSCQRILSADIGYNTFFLEPFSFHTGLNASTIERIRRLFGSQDSDLIEVIGSVVVTKCYNFQLHHEGEEKSKLLLTPCDFVKQTKDVIKFLLDQKSTKKDSHQLHDILVVRSIDPNISKKIRRTAYIQDVPKADHKIIRWIFADISSEQNPWHIPN